MRKTLIMKKIKELYDCLDVKTTAYTSGGHEYKRIENWSEISDILFNLNEYSFVGDSIEKIFEMGACYQSKTDTIAVTVSDFKTFMTSINIVRAKCEAFLDDDVLEDELNNLYVKLPNNLCELKKLEGIISDLNTSFNTCPPIVEKIGNIEFKGVEHGSNWLVLGIASIPTLAASLKWIAEFISKCNEIRLQNATIKNVEIDTILKLGGIDEKDLDKIVSNFKKNTENLIKKECIGKFKEIGITNKNFTPEEEQRITHSMKTMIDLLDEGVEIYPSSNAEEDIRKLFPKREEASYLPSSKQRLITIRKEK